MGGGLKGKRVLGARCLIRRKRLHEVMEINLTVPSSIWYSNIILEVAFNEPL